MKNSFKFGIIAAAALTAFSCSKEVDLQTPEELISNPVGTHTVNIRVKETKTVIEEGVSAASFKWSSDDADRFYLKENSVEGTGISISSSDSYSTITISATFETESAAEYTYSGFLAKNKTGSNKPRVPAAQTCTGSSYDPNADVLVAKPVSFGSTQDDLELQFTRPVVFNKMTLKGLTAGETVSKVTITSDKSFTGYYDTEKNTWTKDGSEIVVTTSQVVPAGGQVVIWFATTPVDAATLTVVAETEDYTYSKTFGATINFVLDQVTRFGVSSLTKTPKADYSDTYVLTSAAGTKMADTYVSGSYIPVKDVTLEGGVVYYDPDEVTISTAEVTLARITDSESEYYGMYTIVQNGKYLYASSSSANNLQAKATLDVNGYWDVTYTDGTWSIVATKSSNRNIMRFNSDRISCYSSTSTGTAVALRSDYAPTPVITADANIPLTSDAVSSNTNTGATFNSNTSSVAASAYSDEECTVVSTWLSVSVSGSGSSSVVNYTATANSTGSPRTAYIKITATNSSSRAVNKVIEVNQDAAGAAKVYTLNFTSISNNCNTYTSSWDQTCSGFTWTLSNFNNNNGGWTSNGLVKCGRKTTASTATIVTKTAIPEAIKTVAYTTSKLTASGVTSITLYVDTANTFDTANLQTISGTVASGEQSITVTTPTANCFYKLEFVCNDKVSSGNGYVELTSVVYTEDK